MNLPSKEKRAKELRYEEKNVYVQNRGSKKEHDMDLKW